MIFRNLDENGDWTFGQGRGNYVDQNTAIGLNIKTRIYSWVGDCFFDENAGIDWNNRLGNKNQRALLELDLRRLILQSENVTGINSFDTMVTNRAFTANFSISTIYSKSYQDTLELEF